MGPMFLMAAVFGMMAYALVDMFDGDTSAQAGASEDDTAEDGVDMLASGDDDVADDADPEQPAGSQDDDASGEDENDDVDIGGLPAVPFTITENDIGGRDVEVTLSTELAQQLVDAGGQFGYPEDQVLAGWQDAEGEALLGLFGIDDLTDQDRININTPEDFAYDITAFYNSYMIDGPGFQGDRLMLSVTPEGTYDDADINTQSIVQGGPLFETAGVDFGPEFVGVTTQAEIDAVVQAAVQEFAVAEEQLEFGAFKYDIYSGGEFGERSVSTPDGTVSFYIGTDGGVSFDVEGPTATEFFPDDVQDTRVFLVQGDDNQTAVVAVAVLPDPQEFVQTVFSVNGAPLTGYQSLFYLA